MRIADASSYRNYAFSASSASKASDVPQELDRQQTAPQRQTDSATTLQTLNSSSNDVKDAAKARLQAAKDLLDVLERWGFPAHIIARQAESLGQAVAKATADFSTAAVSSTAAGAEAGAVTQTPGAELEQAMDEFESVDSEENRRSGLGSLPNAYRDVMGSNDGRGGMSSDDQAMMNEFQTVANRIKALLQKALREMREDAR